MIGSLTSVKSRNQENVFFQIISTLCKIESEGEHSELYEKGLRRFYTETEIETALHITSGTQTFFGLQFGDTWTNISTEHSKLMTVYNNLKKAKVKSIRA